MIFSHEIAAGAERRAPLVFSGADGTDAVLVERLRGAQSTIVARRPDGATASVSNAGYMRLFGDVPLFGVAPDGSFGVLVTRDVATSPRTGAFQVAKVTPAGTRTWARSYAYTPQQVPRATADSMRKVLATMAARLPGGYVLQADDRSRTPTVPAFFPPVSAVVIGGDGTIWLRGPEAGGRMVEWTVLAPDGEPRARARLPAASQVRHAAHDHLWAVEPDADGVPFVVRYRF